jgi:hypothetical protein
MILNGFKVCRVRDGNYYSTRMLNGVFRFRPDAVKYVVGEWVYPIEGFDELSVFSSYNYVRFFVEGMSNVVIFKCEYEPVSWWRHLRLLLGRYRGSPSGKVFAKRVKILQEVEV